MVQEVEGFQSYRFLSFQMVLEVHKRATLQAFFLWNNKAIKTVI